MRPKLAAYLVLIGCGGEDDLTCALLAEPSNCWAEAAAAAAACLPQLGAVGTLAADRASCTFAGGARVVFDAPLPASTFELERLAFSIEAGGTTCARFVDTFMNRMELTAGGKTVVAELHNGGGFHLHCDGGPDYATSFDTLFTCQLPARAPTDGFDVTATSVTFTISAVTTPGELFRCE